MNGRTAKKVRREMNKVRAAMPAMVHANMERLCKLPLRHRVRLAWGILRGRWEAPQTTGRKAQ